MKIRRALDTDVEAVSRLIQSLSQPFFTFQDRRGAEAFLESISKHAITGFISAPNFAYYVGEEEGEIAGVIAIRDNMHLYHLFVTPSQQRQRLGWQLWKHAKEGAVVAGNQGEFTVNSSINAVPVYKAFGFEATSEMKQANGVSFLPMKLKIVPSAMDLP